MERVLVLGATGRAGCAVVAHLADRAVVVAALRSEADVARLPAGRTVASVLIDLDDPRTLREALAGADVVINAVRLREDIPADALVDLHDRVVQAADASGLPHEPLIVTVGGAGSLRLPAGRRFWQHPDFPSRTLPRGRAHAMLRDYLEAGRAGCRWAYLVPPPILDPNGPHTGRYSIVPPAQDESGLTTRTISYDDYALALADAAVEGWDGTHLVAG